MKKKNKEGAAPSKHYFSLLEILIALTIAMGVLVTGLYFYRYATLMDSSLKKEEASALKSRLLAARLSNTFSHIDKKPFFTAQEAQGVTLGPSLIFAFEEQSRDPKFHGKVLARLFVDPDKRLQLVIWPLKGQDSMPPMHYEVLAEKIEGISFNFLVGPDDIKTPGLNPGAFLSEWSPEYDSLPAAIKILLKGEVETEFAFPLVSRAAES